MKIEAKESRIKILETKIHELQDKIKIILDKTNTDDQLIILLQKELQKIKYVIIIIKYFLKTNIFIIEKMIN